MRISDWSSDGCSSDLNVQPFAAGRHAIAELLVHVFGVWACMSGFVGNTVFVFPFFHRGLHQTFQRLLAIHGSLVFFKLLRRREATSGTKITGDTPNGSTQTTHSGIRDRNTVVKGKSVTLRVDLG